MCLLLSRGCERDSLTFLGRNTHAEDVTVKHDVSPCYDTML